MALAQTKVVTLTAESKVEEVLVARFSATVNSANDVNSTYSEQILSTELYNANKIEVRADIDAFRAAIYALEDELDVEV